MSNISEKKLKLWQLKSEACGQTGSFVVLITDYVSWWHGQELTVQSESKSSAWRTWP
jgi:hypothetical protein